MPLVYARCPKTRPRLHILWIACNGHPGRAFAPNSAAHTSPGLLSRSALQLPTGQRYLVVHDTCPYMVERRRHADESGGNTGLLPFGGSRMGPEPGHNGLSG